MQTIFLKSTSNPEQKTLSNRFLNYCLITFFLSGCSGVHDERATDSDIYGQSPMIIDIARDYNNEIEFRLSEIAYDIEYIKLEATPESLIGGGLRNHIVTDDYIFIYEQRRLLQFDRTGKFVKQIGREGRGPGEVLLARNFAMDKENNIIYMLANFKNEILKYDATTGEFLGSFQRSEYLGDNTMQGAFQVIGNGILASLSQFMTQYRPEYVLLEVFDNEGNILKKHKSHIFSYQNDEKIEKMQFVSHMQTWIFQDQLRLFERGNDTIYTLVELMLEPEYILNLGKYKKPLHTGIYRSDRYIHLYSFRETKSALYFLYTYDDEMFSAKYSKENGQFFRFVNPDGQKNRIHNDVDGGLSIWPYYYEGELEDEWYYLVDAINMKQMLTPEYLKESEAKYPEKKEDLKEFIEELSIEDNPVIMIIKLRD